MLKLCLLQSSTLIIAYVFVTMYADSFIDVGMSDPQYLKVLKEFVGKAHQVEGWRYSSAGSVFAWHTQSRVSEPQYYINQP